MKTRLLSVLALVLVAAFTCTWSHAEGSASGPKLVQSYTDVLAVIPGEFSPKRAGQWTELKKSMVNRILKENVADLHTPAKFQGTVSQVAHWPDLTLFWEVPNQEGYHIRVFAHFTDDWKARLSMLNVGDPVIIEGTFFKADFENLWGSNTLCLCLGGSSFTKGANNNGQTQAAPVERKTTRVVDSAVTSSVLASTPSSIEPPAAKVIVDSSHGAMTFANSDLPSDARGFELSEKQWTAKELSDSIKGGESALDRFTLGEAGWNQKERFGVISMMMTIYDSRSGPPATAPVETSVVRSATFQVLPESAVQITLISSPRAPRWEMPMPFTFLLQ